jgi:hypothetical protein
MNVVRRVAIACLAVVALASPVSAQSPAPVQFPDDQSWLDYVQQMDSFLQEINYQLMGVGSTPDDTMRLWLPVALAAIETSLGTTVQPSSCLQPAVDGWRAAMTSNRNLVSDMLASLDAGDGRASELRAKFSDDAGNLHVWNDIVWPVMDKCRG